MSKDGALFGRCYSLALATEGSDTPTEYSNVGKDPSALRLTFDVQKNVKSTPNKATISIYNLSAESRGGFSKGTLVTLAAGYDDLVQNLFLGVVQRATSDRSGSDIVTKLECGDGEPALTKTKLDRFFPPNTTVAQIFQACAEAMSLATSANPGGMNAGIALGIPNSVYGRGFLATGLARDTMDYLCKTHGLEWSIQNGALDIIPIGKHAGTEAVLLNGSTGLLGVPSLNEKTLTFSALLNPGLVPNRLVQIDSLDTRLSGFYKIGSAKYTGDTHESKWQADCEATAIPNATAQSLPAAAGFDYTSAVA
jgi:hypothetical protein